jgi:hypothetical protein
MQAFAIGTHYIILNPWRNEMNGNQQAQNIDFTVDRSNMYREESITDLKVASIRKLVPINIDGTEDSKRTALFMAHTQLMTPEGPLPIQAPLAANTLEAAMDEFPQAMKAALAEVIEEIRKMHQQHQKKNESRIIVPGR